MLDFVNHCRKRRGWRWRHGWRHNVASTTTATTTSPSATAAAATTRLHLLQQDVRKARPAPEASQASLEPEPPVLGDLQRLRPRPRRQGGSGQASGRGKLLLLILSSLWSFSSAVTASEELTTGQLGCLELVCESLFILPKVGCLAK